MGRVGSRTHVRACVRISYPQVARSAGLSSTCLGKVSEVTFPRRLALGLTLGSLLTASLGTSVATAATPAVETSAAAMTAPSSALAFPIRPARANTADARISALLPSRSVSASLGSTTGSIVTNPATGVVVWGKGATRSLIPASTMKILTATAALQTMGSERRFVTSVRPGAAAGSIVLVGGGDPGLTSGQLRSLAIRTAAKLRAKGISKITVRVDASRFAPWSPPSFWSPAGLYSEVAPVRALTRDGRRVRNSAADAAAFFCASMTTAKVTATCAGVGRPAKGRAAIASFASARLSELVRHMLYVSDNDYAETLLRQVAIARGYPATFSGGTAAVRRTLTERGVDLSGAILKDGSGLSRQNRLSAAHLASVLRLPIAGNPRLRPLLTAGLLPTSARTGTLAPRYHRFTTAPSSCAAGKVFAKTGSLRGVVSLAGYTKASDGGWRAFAFLVNNRPAGFGGRAPRAALDAMAATVTGCW